MAIPKRSPTRGLRPWLLIPKVIAVGLFAGGLAAAAVLWFAHSAELARFDKPRPQDLWLVNVLGTMFRYLIIPALLAAIVLGISLFLQHPRIFLRLRWLQVKLTIVLVMTPASHLWMSSRLGVLRQAYEGGATNAAAVAQLNLGFAVTLAWVVLVIVLGRLKPRLGQNWARSYPPPRRAEGVGRATRNPA
ncbi:MAG: hypothetical protein WD042_15735 [Phycisphaeraceae bacterium]